MSGVSRRGFLRGLLGGALVLPALGAFAEPLLAAYRRRQQRLRADLARRTIHFETYAVGFRVKREQLPSGPFRVGGVGTFASQPKDQPVSGWTQSR